MNTWISFMSAGFGFGLLIGTMIGFVFHNWSRKKWIKMVERNHDLYMDEFINHGKTSRLLMDKTTNNHLLADEIKQLGKKIRRSDVNVKQLRDQLARAERQMKHAKSVGYTCTRCRKQVTP